MNSLFKSVIDGFFTLVYGSEVRVFSIVSSKPDENGDHVSMTTISVNLKSKASSQPTVKKENLNG